MLSERSAEDIFAGRIRLTLAGAEYELRTLPIEEEERWLAGIEKSPLAGMFGGIPDDSSAALRMLVSPGASDSLLDMLADYDKAGVLPPKDELRKTARAVEIVRAVLEVWQAAHPLLGISLLGMQQMASLTQTLGNGRSPQDTNSPRPTGAGKRRRSARS